MTTVITMLVTALVALAVGALLVERRRVAVARRVDSITAKLRGETPITSGGLRTALERLDRVAEQHADVAPVEQLEVERYRAALGSITLGVLLVDESGDTIYKNPFAETFLEGRHGDALVGQTIDELAARALAEAPAEREVQVYGPPRKTLFVTATPIREDGFDLGAVILIDDITEQERLDAMRRDFVANISHELRTPIGAVSLLAETMADESDPAVIEKLASRISGESERLAHTVDDLLELSRIEHGSDETFEPVVVQHVIGAAHDRVRAAAEQRGIGIGVTMPSEELVVEGDARQLTSAVFNLLDNGVKYIGNDGGVVSVRARQVGREVELVVQDSGIGVPRKDLERIFERFYRVDRGRSRASGGTGLGLAIVRHVVANHGGRISVDSTEGEGTTFTLQLPARRTAGDEGQEPEGPSNDDGNGDQEVVHRE